MPELIRMHDRGSGIPEAMTSMQKHIIEAKLSSVKCDLTELIEENENQRSQIVRLKSELEKANDSRARYFERCEKENRKSEHRIAYRLTKIRELLRDAPKLHRKYAEGIIASDKEIILTYDNQDTEEQRIRTIAQEEINLTKQ